ncbi:MAG: M48 family metallopeptidase [Prevotella sp.]|nr:M48 family metallopeptidase [Prevotella sp.]
MKTIKTFILTLALGLLAAACGTTNTVPITGRKQSLMVSDQQVASLALQQYQQYMQQAQVSTDAANTAMVKRVGQRLASSVETYLKNNGLQADLQNYAWEFNLVRDQQVNAWCMPGGKIVVYEGLLPVTQDEASLAVVLGHEIAHAVAKHSAERLSNAYKQQYAMQAGGALLQGAGVSADWMQLGSLVANLGSQLWTSGFSRKQESEADHIGLIFAAMAGYDPQVAVSFWQRMAKATGGGGSSLLSDHPSDAQRIEQIQGWMAEALRYYQPATGTKKGSTKKGSKTKSTPTPKTSKTLHIK